MCGCAKLTMSNMAGEKKCTCKDKIEGKPCDKHLKKFNKKVGLKTPSFSNFDGDEEEDEDDGFNYLDEDEPTKKTLSDKLKDNTNNGTYKNAADTVSSWIDTIGKGIGVVKSTKNGSTGSSSSTSSGDDSSSNSDESSMPSYIWWIVGLLVLLLAIWGFIHFSKK